MQKKTNKRKRRENGYQLARQTGYSNFERITFLDPHKYVKLVYSQLISTTVALATGAQQIFNLNSIFDPDRTGGGHQPYGYDQLAALYNRYRVLKTKWHILFQGESVGFRILAVPTNGLLASAVTTAATFETASEVPRSRIFAQSASAPPVTINGSISLNALNGVTRTEYLGDDRFESQIAASPSEIMVLYIAWYNVSGGTINVDFQVQLEYFVDLHDPILVAGS